ncbi:MAG TPA: AAA family ATPase [Solirubrobacteraceae bacterium]|jgi:DNA-binding CsgD family transcriptional regulator|nr:AAA family ATPase [Solirubrobacteraceae bacterium]
MHASGAVGRETELAEVDGFLMRLQTASCALAVEGEPGIGKTTLWHETLRRAGEGGGLVLSCRPAAAEAKLSFSGLSDMLAAIGPELLGRLPAPQRNALEVALLRAAPDGPTLDPRLVGTALLSLVRTLSATRVVILAVDDAQWLDGPTSSVLAFAARRLDREPVGVVFALRPNPAGLGLLRSLERERVVRVRVGPLAIDPLRRLIGERLARPLPLPLLTRIAEASGGNPFYALEVAMLLRQGDVTTDGSQLPVPEDVRALAQSRVSALPEPTRAALLLATVLAVPEIRFVDADALGPAEDVGLVRVDPRGRIEFSHPLFAAAIYSSASAAQRREAHRTAAGEVIDAEERARHLALGSPRPDPKVAAELDAAAELACSRGAPDAAAELVELALLRTPLADDHNRLVRLERAAALHSDAGNAERARDLLTTLLDEPAPDRLRADALRLRATLESHSESFATALQTATEALAAAGGEPSIAAAIELDIAFYLVALGDVGDALRHAEAAVGRAELPGGDPGVLADALAVVTIVGFLSGDGLSQERLDRALALEEPNRPRALFTTPRYIAGLLLVWTGRLREAVQTLEELRTERIERGVESDIPAFSLYLVWAYLWLGETERARQLAADDAAAVELLGDPGLIAVARSASALVRAHCGELDAARADAAVALEHLSKLQWWTGTVWPRWALGFAELSAGRPAEAHQALAPLTETLPAMGLADPAGLVFLPDEIEALIALGELEQAEALIELLDRLGRAHDRPWATAAAGRGRGLLAAARGALDEAIALLEGALKEHDRVEMPFERGRTLLALGRVRRRRKKWARARKALREAHALFLKTGSPLWADAAQSELARAGERSADPAELTPTERRVAELAASGLTNQEVAERAFLTVKGVEANLTRAYRKLGIRSRAGLQRALRDGDEPVAPA